MSKDDGDYLGYGVYADTLWARIARALNKDAAGGTLGDDPLVVGIFGEWGAGKSKLLSMVLKRAMAQQKEQQARRDLDPGFTLTVPVFFQPWKYEHEPHLHVPLVMHITAALKDALKSEPGLLPALQETADKAWWQANRGKVLVHTGAKVAKKVYPALQTAVGSISVFGTSIQLPDELGDWLKDTADATSSASEDLEKLDKKRAAKRTEAAERNAKRKITHTGDGLYFYRINEYLKKITRPGADDDIKANLQGADLTKSTRINFVIFIDDLDRCLPEKAVEALELIKTVFNLESFAFVLALDEEVVERGIGHRYKDYALRNKKPEMPITGFEYLEKIVHLPFRLPALTRAEGLEFLRQYEDQFLKQRGGDGTPWFTERTEASTQVVTRAGWDTREERRGFQSAFDPADIASPGATPVEQGAAYFHLGHLVVNSFSAYVPRKLVRVVELFHQTLDVLNERKDHAGKPRFDEVALGGKLDPRLLLAFILLQLFHPDLYRACRRTGKGFDVLRDAHVARQLEPDFADVDLMHWAVYGTPEAKPPRSREDLQAHLVDIKDRGIRGPAERIRVPLLNCLLDHRAAQRHAFDPLNLFYALARSAELVPLDRSSTGHLFGLLAEDSVQVEPGPDWLGVVRSAQQVPAPDARVVGRTPSNAAGVDTGQTASSASRRIDVRALYTGLTSAEEREQEAATTSGNLQSGEVLSPSAARELLPMLTKWLASFNDDAARKAPRVRLLRGMRYFAPHVPHSFAPAFWDLVEDADHGGELGEPIEDIDQLAARELWADVRSTLGADPRWDTDFWHLPKARFAGHDDKMEPIPGFVRVPAGEFSVGAKDRLDNLPRLVPSRSDFFIARHLTTVDQFAAFVRAGGYEDDEWWDRQGAAWRTGKWSSMSSDETVLRWLRPRTLRQRQRPMLWDEQRPHGSRPVWGVNWFEARAYARWLSAQFAETLVNAGLGSYQVSLPIELEWERAAKAVGPGAADNRIWPWGDDHEPVHLRANIEDSKIGRACVVGLFAPNPLGLFDLAGNLWEWQDNLVQDKGRYRAWARIPKMVNEPSNGQESQDWLVTSQEWKDSALPALRGGSWMGLVGQETNSFRFGQLPDMWNVGFGFRLVLAPASKGYET